MANTLNLVCPWNLLQETLSSFRYNKVRQRYPAKECKKRFENARKETKFIILRDEHETIPEPSQMACSFGLLQNKKRVKTLFCCDTGHFAFEICRTGCKSLVKNKFR